MKSSWILALSVSGLFGASACFVPDDDDGDDQAADTEGDDGTAGSSGVDDEGDNGDGDSDGSDDGPPTGPGDAGVRVVHGAPGAGAVDVYVEGVEAPVVANLQYGEATEYLALEAGDYNFQVRAAGSSPFDAPAYETGTLSIPAGASITALASGLLGSERSADRFRVLPLVEDFEPAGAGEAVVRVVHAGADAPNVDLDVGDDGTSELTELVRFDDTGASGIALPAGEALQIGIVAGGERVTAFTTPELPEGGELFVIATGLLGKLPREADGFSLLAVGESGAIGLLRQNPTVYALHAGPDAPEIDLCTNGVALVTHAGFGELDSVQVPPGEYAIDVFAAPSGCMGAPVLTNDLPPLQAGERYLAIATGELTPSAGEPPLQLRAYTERFTDAAPEAALRLIHAASAPQVDVGIVTGGVIESEVNLLAAGLKWPDESDEARVSPVTYQVGVAAAGAAFPIHPLVSFHVTAAEAGRAWIIAAGDLSPETLEQGFGLIAIDTTTAPWTAGAIAAN